MSPLHPKGYGSIDEELANDPQKLAEYDKRGEKLLKALKRGITKDKKIEDKTENWIKKESDGILILFIFTIIIIFGLTGIWDYLFKFIYSILSGLSDGGNPDYIPGENFPWQ